MRAVLFGFLYGRHTCDQQSSTNRWTVARGWCCQELFLAADAADDCGCPVFRRPCLGCLCCSFAPLDTLVQSCLAGYPVGTQAGARWGRERRTCSLPGIRRAHVRSMWTQPCNSRILSGGWCLSSIIRGPDARSYNKTRRVTSSAPVHQRTHSPVRRAPPFLRPPLTRYSPFCLACVRTGNDLGSPSRDHTTRTAGNDISISEIVDVNCKSRSLTRCV